MVTQVVDAITANTVSVGIGLIIFREDGKIEIFNSAGERVFQGRLPGLGSGGFRLEVPEPPRIGEHATLRVERSEEFPVQIRWALGNEAGGVFLTPVETGDWS